ncbi:MAG: hypothetical protein HN849_30160 [Victivallales bacterium]|nr:hypothetical protein [Victivallales bacterium]
MRPYTRQLVQFTQAVLWIACSTASVPVGADTITEAGLKPAAPGPWALECSTNPILQEARRCDLRLADPGNIDQKKVEELYLRFVDQFPDHRLVQYVYVRLGHTFADWAGPSLKSRGVVRDHTKALAYFKKAVGASDGKDANGLYYMIVCRVNVAALAPKREDKVREYMDYYQWIGELSKEKSERVTKGVLRTIRGMRHVSAVNMVSVAWENAQHQRSDLLKLIADRFPDEEAGALALQKLKE